MKVKTTPELEQISNEIAELTKKGKQEALYNFFDMGQKLKEAQQMCYNQRIHFDKWIKTHIELSKSHVYKLIKLYNHKPEIEAEIKAGNTKYITFNKIYDMLPKEKKAHATYINYNNKNISTQETEFKSADEIKAESPQETEVKTPCKKLLYSIYTLIDMNPEICCCDKTKEMIKESGLINIP